MRKKAKSYFDNRLKPPKAFFEWCYSKFSAYEWENKSQKIISTDRPNAHISQKRLTKKTRLTFFETKKHFAIVLCTSKRIEIQTYDFFQNYYDGQEKITMNIRNLEIFENDEHIKVCQCGEVCYWGLESTVSVMMGGPYYNVKFFDNKWPQQLAQKSELKYLKTMPQDRYELINAYKYRREIEFCEKIKAYRLADEILYRAADMRVVNQRWLHENKQFFKKSDNSFNLFEMERRFKARNGKLVLGIDEYLDWKDIKHIPEGIGMIRFQNWAIKNKLNFKYYLDYLRLLSDLGVDPAGDENLIIPKDLVVAHDNAVDMLNILKEEELRKKNEADQAEYQETLAKRRKLEGVVDGFLFKLPDELHDLFIEGKTLHHCVGGSRYAKDHRKGKTTIIFVRMSSEPDKPLYTLEYQRGHIIQFRGKRNMTPPAEAKAAADHWLQLIKKKKVG